jgi:hypothetical protein
VLARLGKASVDGERRRLVVTGADLMSQFDDFEASRLARVDEEVARHEAKPQGFTAVLGRTPNDGDEDDWCGQGFGVGKNWSRGGRKRGPRVIVELKYCEEMRLVTNSDEERAPARGRRRARRRAIVQAP